MRIFTQVGETPFAGHPTLGTAYVIQQTMAEERVETVTLDLRVGKIPVRFTYRKGEPDVLWMKQLNPTFGKTHEPETFAGFLGIDADDIDPRYPI